MEVVIDPDVKAVAEFMQSRIETRKLMGVAESLRVIAPLLWGHYEHAPVRSIELASLPITSERLLVASESPLGHTCAGGGFAVAAATNK
jgi:hypothetical protein